MKMGKKRIFEIRDLGELQEVKKGMDYFGMLNSEEYIKIAKTNLVKELHYAIA
ncbi:MAG: hypothetical protein PHG41_05555 [Actinomycetota bacterium]|nr:hypothetical protein [Actinomycetota bacterium]